MKNIDYNDWTKDELITRISQLEQDRKYGLVWDEEKIPETVVTECSTKLPILHEVKEKELQTFENLPTNIVIEGDNFHALSVLNYTHKGKIDLIYIDPPYNTGSKDFKYNDNYVEREDVFKHSKWLSFMSKRLILSRDLLNDEGIIFISINENEQAHLKLLCDKIFGEPNYLTMFTIKVRHEERILRGDKDFHEVVEYLLLYRKSDKFKTIKRIKDNTSIDEYIYEIKELTTTPKEIKCDNKIVLEFKDNEFEIVKSEANKNKLKKINIRGSIKEGNSSGRFFMKYLEPTMKEKKGYLYKVPNMGDDGFGYRYFLLPSKATKANGDYFQGEPTDRKDTKEVPFPNFFDFIEDFNNVGYEGGVEFRNGKKPISFIKKCLEIGGFNRKKNGIILDFFAGSGTTGHAVLDMNYFDSGQRQFILCTNNEINGLKDELEKQGKNQDEILEYGICRSVLYKRLSQIISGFNGTLPIPTNLKYYETDFIVNQTNKEQLKYDLTQKCTEMLCLKVNIFREYKTHEDYRIFKQVNKYMAVFYNFPNSNLEDLKNDMNNIDGEKILFFFSSQKEINKKDFEDWKNINIEPIPQQILDVYNELIKKIR